MARRERPAILQLQPVSQGSNLVAALSAMIENEMRSGRLNVGDRLPPEAELCAAAGVSRTVVREAVAELRAAGLIETRRGAGAFVVAESDGTFAVPRIKQATLDDILAVLELRLIVEVEAAAVAALRRSDGDLEALEHAARTLEQYPAEGVVADMAFHQAIAGATRNRYLADFIANLGRHAFPRQHIGAPAVTRYRLEDQIDRICLEHRRILEAIRNRDSTSARKEMRNHLAGSRSRYKALGGTPPD